MRSCAGGRFKENGAIFTHHDIKKSQKRPHGLEIGKVAARDKKSPHVRRAELAQSSQGRCIDDCVCCDGAVEVSGKSAPFHVGESLPRRNSRACYRVDG